MKGRLLLICAALFAVALFDSSVHSAEIKVDSATLDMISQMIMKMQQETMAKMYPQMPLKDQMRGRMMAERASQNYMQNVIQPQMMQKNMGAEKLRIMNRMSAF